MDNIRVYPQNATFEIDSRELSVSGAGSAGLTLNAGPSYGGKDYIIFASVTGTYPGFSVSGVDVPLNLDVFTWLAFSLINTPVFSNFMSVLDGSGQATANFQVFSATPEALGMAIYFDYVLLANPGKTPILFASNPVYALFIP